MSIKVRIDVSMVVIVSRNVHYPFCLLMINNGHTVYIIITQIKSDVTRQ